MNLFIPSYSKWMLPAGMLLAPFAMAIEPPADDAAPPAVAGENQAQPQAAQVEEAAFIGLVSGPIPELLTTHLGIREGEGILVRSVMPDGPAEKAGIKTNDIIISIDGQAAMSPADFSKIIRSHQPGDEVKVGLISHGKGTEINVTLDKRPGRLANFRNGNAADMMRMQGMPDDMAERIRDLIEGNMMEFRLDGEALEPGIGQADAQRAMEELRERMKQMRQQQWKGFGEDNAMHFEQNATIRVMDNEGSIEISSKDGESHLTARDQDNKVVWEGPWDTDEDKAAAPEGIRERAGKLNIGGKGGIQLRLGR